MMKKSILEIYALAVCFVALVCFVIALGIGVYDLIQIANPVFTINAYEYNRHQSNEAFRRFPGLFGMVGPGQAFGSGWATRIQESSVDGWSTSFARVGRRNRSARSSSHLPRRVATGCARRIAMRGGAQTV